MLKPAGMTSHDAVSFLRRLTGIKRIGHTGTLDPMAVGVLPVCIGSAARIVEYLDLDCKSYRCELQLGLETDTLDIWGSVLEDSVLSREDMLAKKITEKNVRELLESFRGEIFQYPPKYSAIRVDGKRLYEYARQGREVEIKPRKVTIIDISLVRCELESGTITFDVSCSKGTYIRSICAEIGQKLGTGAVMSFLVRTGSGIFKLEDAVSVERLAEIQSSEDLNDKTDFFKAAKPYLYPIDKPLVYLGEVMVNLNRGAWFITGGYLTPRDFLKRKESEYQGIYKVYLDDGSPNGKFLGTAAYDAENDILKAEKVFAKTLLSEE